MTSQPVEPARPVLPPIDPASPRGIRVTHELAVIRAGVIDRLRREGKPVPGDAPSTSP